MSGRSRGAIALAAVVMLVTAVASSTARPGSRDQDPTAGCTPSPGWGTPHPELVPRALALINTHRVSLGLPRLALGSQLVASAVWKARHMAAYEYVDNDDPAPPVRRSVFARFAACGYTGLIAAENLAVGLPDAEAVTTEWLRDPGTRGNMEHQGYRLVGIAAAASTAGELYWVADFGAPRPPSVGSQRCRVPSVVRMSLAAARQALRRAHCRVGVVSRAYSRRVARGRVIAQAPRPGATLRSGARVRLVVSSGRRPRS